ncbi:MAG: tetratricopeptide repeat protein [Chitinophagaceae bacterium]
MDRIEKLKQFLDLTPHDPFLMYALGLEYRKLGQSEECLFWFNKALEVDPDYIGSYQQLGSYWLEKGDRSKALSFWQGGMDAARRKGDRHAAQEISQWLDDLSED